MFDEENNDHVMSKSDFAAMCDEINQLKANVDNLQRDADRYRWLRSENRITADCQDGKHTFSEIGSIDCIFVVDSKFSMSSAFGEELDNAIDKQINLESKV